MSLRDEVYDKWENKGIKHVLSQLDDTERQELIEMLSDPDGPQASVIGSILREKRNISVSDRTLQRYRKTLLEGAA